MLPLLQPGKRYASCLFKSIILRRLSSEALAAQERDVFGTLSESGKRSLQVQLADKTIPDDPDGYDKVEFDIEPRKNAYWYKYEITKYARQGPIGLRRALELFQEMKAKARLEPTVHNFSPLVFGCAKAGYTKRAFDLYDESLRYMRKPTKSMVTCLINACAESPFPEYGLKRLKWFLTHVKVEYNWQFNEIQYNSAIKAFGKLGQLDEASKLIQEMLDNGVTPTVDTFNMLLIGCVSDRESGCAIALRVFKRLKMYNFKPTVVTYRLLLRCIRECGLGSAKLLEQTINELPAMTTFDQRINYKRRAQSRRNSTSVMEWLPLISDVGRSIQAAISEPQGSSRDKSIQNVANKIDVIDSAKQQPVRNLDDKLFPVSGMEHHHELPNLLSDDHLDVMSRIKSIQFDKLKYPSQRMLLFGGVRGFLETMIHDDSKPDEKTFSLMLPCLHATRENYLDYHKLAVGMNIKRDLVYYNQLIKHICDHGLVEDRLDLSLHFIEQMHLDHLRPDISTFESVAGSCGSWKKARQLLDDVEKSGYTVSSAMIARLLRRASKNMNFHYLNNLIDYCAEVKFRPLKHQVEDLENLRLKANDLILKQERASREGECIDHTETSRAKHFKEYMIEDFDRFQKKLNFWLKSTTLQEEDHPWKQFKVDTSSRRDGFSAFKKYFKELEKAKEEWHTSRAASGSG